MAATVQTRTDVAAFHTRRRLERETDGPRIEAVFRALTGFEPMPWQLDFWDIVGERLTDQECRALMVEPGTPAYREIALGVPRRASKTTSAFAVLVDQCTRQKLWGTRTPKAVYSAQTGNDARKKFLRDFKPLLDPATASPAIRRRVERVLTANGGEAAMFRNGSGIYLGGNTAESDHGQDYDTAVIDEAFADADNRREAAISPGQLTMPWAQRIITSTAGTAESLYWNAKCVAGRKAVEADTGHGMAYIEFSMPPGASILDESLWPVYHPACGYSINAATLRFEIEQMIADPDKGEAEAMRAYGNVPTVRIYSQTIPAADWEAVCDEDATAQGAGPWVWSYDVADDRSWSAIVVCDVSTGTCAVTDYARGTEWVESTLDERLVANKGSVVFDATGPGANIGAGKRGWVGLTRADMVQSFADFLDAVSARTLTVRKSPFLDAAVTGAEVRASSDSRMWSRSRSRVDIAPLVALTIAATQRPAPPRKMKPFLI